jgi:hypothetical protein
MRQSVFLTVGKLDALGQSQEPNTKYLELAF